MRGFFGIGVEGIHKAQNVGSLVRSAHAFGASFFYTVSPALNVQDIKYSDTSGAFDHLPYYEYRSIEEFELPQACQLVGVEFLPDAVELPSFRHPTRAAYILGPEMGSLSPAALKRCDHIIKIPMKFCINVGVAGALVMYDRLISLGRHAARPVKAGGPTEGLPEPVHGRMRYIAGEKAE